MTPKERQKLRQDCLKNAYEYYFANDQKGLHPTLDLSKEQARENYFALKYLIDKGFLKETGKNYTIVGEIAFTITADGIDAVESMEK